MDPWNVYFDSGLVDLAVTMSGQSIMDRVTAAKHSIAGQGLAKTVCKATTEEVMGPKKKHLDCKSVNT